MVNDILVRFRKHPSLPVLCFSDGTVVRESKRRDCKRQTYGNLSAGYRIVRIEGKVRLVHRLIAETFLPNPEQKPTVDHIDRDRENNSLENLRWATAKEQADNRDFVLNRHDVGEKRFCNDMATYVRERRKYIRETGHGYGKRPVLDDEFHRKKREICRRYRENHPDRIKASNHKIYLKRRKENES